MSHSNDRAMDSKALLNQTEAYRFSPAENL